MRLLFFGDSSVYGQGFADCTYPDLPLGECKHSISNWPSMVAAAFDCEYLNLSTPGASNQEIFYAIRMFDIQPNDFIVAQWTYLDRDIIMENKIEFTRINPWLTDKSSERYYRLHNEWDSTRRGSMTIEHAALWLSYHNHDHIMVSNNAFENDINKIILDNEAKHAIDYFGDDDSGVGLGHPGLETNKAWATVVEKHIRDYLGGTRVSISKVVR